MDKIRRKQNCFHNLVMSNWKRACFTVFVTITWRQKNHIVQKQYFDNGSQNWYLKILDVAYTIFRIPKGKKIYQHQQTVFLLMVKDLRKITVIHGKKLILWKYMVCVTNKAVLIFLFNENIVNEAEESFCSGSGNSLFCA